MAIISNLVVQAVWHFGSKLRWRFLHVQMPQQALQFCTRKNLHLTLSTELTTEHFDILSNFEDPIFSGCQYFCSSNAEAFRIDSEGLCIAAARVLASKYSWSCAQVTAGSQAFFRVQKQ